MVCHLPHSTLLITSIGALVLSLESQPILGFNEYFLSLRPGNPAFERNKWLAEWWEHKYQCTYDVRDTITPQCSQFTQSRPEFSPDNKVC
jgi:hypothetical protein